jgi:hypothetical protein
MTDAVLFRDVESVAMNYLQPYVPGIPVVTRIPNPRPDLFVRVIRTGGPQETLISERAMLTVEAWGASERDAINLLNVCRAWLNRSDGLMFGVQELAGPVNLPDPISSQTRYTMTFQIRVRGTRITAP